MLCWLRQRLYVCTQGELEELKKQSTVIRVIAHTQIKKVSNWGQKKAHLLEVQVCAYVPRSHVPTHRITRRNRSHRSKPMPTSRAGTCRDQCAQLHCQAGGRTAWPPAWEASLRQVRRLYATEARSPNCCRLDPR